MALSTTQKFGGGLVVGGIHKRTMPLNLHTGRILSSGAIETTTLGAGVLSVNSTPALATTSSVDPSLGISWASSVTSTVLFGTRSPIDLNSSQALVVKMSASRAGNTDTCVMHCAFFEGVGGSDLLAGAAGNTANLGTAASITSFSIAKGSYTAKSTTPLQWNLLVSPQAHTTDAITVQGVWIEYPTVS